MSGRRSEKKEKYKTINQLLDQYDYVLVHVDTRAPDVKIPEYLYANPTVTLKVSRLFRRPLTLTEEALVCDLLFNSEYFTCRVPLSSLWGVTTADGQNMLWPGSTPEQILEQVLKTGSKAAGEEAAVTREPKPDRKGCHLRRVK